MKVHELVASLKKFDADADVVTSDCCFGWSLSPEAGEVKYHLDDQGKPSRVEDWELEPEHLDWRWDGTLPEIKTGVMIK